MTDDELVLRARSGDEAAFEELVDRYQPLLSHGRTFFSDWLDRDDFAQHARIGLWQAVRDYDPAASRFYSFAWLCVRREVITALKFARRAKHRMLSDALSIDAPRLVGDDELVLRDAIEGGVAAADEAVERERFAGAVAGIRAALDQMSAIERLAFAMFEEGYSLDEIEAEIRARTGRRSTSFEADGTPRPRMADNALVRARRKVLGELDRAA